MTLREILARREVIRLEMRSIVDAHPDGNLPEDKATRFTALEAEAATLNAAETRQAAIDDLDRRSGGSPVTVEQPEAEGATVLGLRREQRMVDLVQRQTGIAAAGLSAGRAIRGKITGNWEGADAERRAMGESVGTTGGFLLPSPVSANIIDLVRNKAVLINAGAITIPMSNQTLRVVQVTADPTANLRGEGVAITESQGTFAALNLNAWSIGALVRVNNELIDDAPAFAAELDHQLSMIMALKMDYLGLYGTGASQPLGLRNVVGLQEVSMGANGVAFSGASNWDNILDLLQDIEQANGTPDTLVWAPRSKYELAKIKDSQGVYLNNARIADAAASLRKLTSNQVSVTETKGDASTASTVFVGGFENVAIAIRQDITIEISREADGSFKQNQTMIRALARFDVGVIRPDKLGRLIGIL